MEARLTLEWVILGGPNRVGGRVVRKCGIQTHTRAGDPRRPQQGGRDVGEKVWKPGSPIAWVILGGPNRVGRLQKLVLTPMVTPGTGGVAGGGGRSFQILENADRCVFRNSIFGLLKCHLYIKFMESLK